MEGDGREGDIDYYSRHWYSHYKYAIDLASPYTMNLGEIETIFGNFRFFDETKKEPTMYYGMLKL